MVLSSKVDTSHRNSVNADGVTPMDRAARRALDVAVAVLVLVAAAPLLGLIALAVVLESPGSVLYRAERVGHRGRRLRLLKFRKMRADAVGLPLTVDGDRRLTRIGRVLARTRLDELPQFWQVLTGSMSLVGPRPEDPVFVAQRPDDYAVILAVRPGLTGFSQLAFADEWRILSSSDPIADYTQRVLPQKCALDRLYVQRASLATNLRVLVWTVVPVVLRHPVAVERATGAISLRRRRTVISDDRGSARRHADARADLTASTTRRCCSTVMCANKGSVTVCSPYRSVIGSDGAPSRNAVKRWTGG
jgi:lipopolysaccharide/colanic/teichoic acid biosynthesis glycosyltransferase